MASNNISTYTSVKDVLQDVWTVILKLTPKLTLEVEFEFEFGDLLLSEEEMIDAGCDPEVDSAVGRYVQGLALFF